MLTSPSSDSTSRGARLVVDPRDHRGGEVQDLLELLRGHVEQVADPARDALEEPDVRHRRGQVDVAHALAADLRARDLDAAALADDALVADALVLAAVALPVLRRTEDALAEQPVLLGLERAVVDRLRLGDLAGAPGADLLRGGEADLDGVEVIDVDQSDSLLVSVWSGWSGLLRGSWLRWSSAHDLVLLEYALSFAGLDVRVEHRVDVGREVLGHELLAGLEVRVLVLDLLARRPRPSRPRARSPRRRPRRRWRGRR